MERLTDSDAMLDAQEFRLWDREGDFPGKDLLHKDLIRTRKKEPFFNLPETSRALELMVTFYCIREQIDYQQGLPEVAVPFLLLRSKDFHLHDCYGYFSSFMRRYFPGTLLSVRVEGKKELPLALCGVVLCETLLKYHAPGLLKLLLDNELILASIVTPWIMTLMARDNVVPLIYHIFDLAMREPPHFVIFLACALIQSREDELQEANREGRLLEYTKTNLPKFRSKS
jgi:hypothetical protein